jgi:hypothetical protein
MGAFYFVQRRVVPMKLSDHLDNNTKTKLTNLTDKKKPSSKKRKRQKPKENLTDRDFRELMGEFKDTYKRSRGGAMRRR